jgi:hypothetical protein
MVRAIDPNRLLLWQMLFSLPIYFLGSALLGNGAYQFSLPGLLALLYQGVLVASVCFIVWTALLKSYSHSRRSVILFTTPLFGTVLSRLVLGEPVSSHLGAGGSSSRWGSRSRSGEEESGVHAVHRGAIYRGLRIVARCRPLGDSLRSRRASVAVVLDITYCSWALWAPGRQCWRSGSSRSCRPSPLKRRWSARRSTRSAACFPPTRRWSLRARSAPPITRSRTLA